MEYDKWMDVAEQQGLLLTPEQVDEHRRRWGAAVPLDLFALEGTRFAALEMGDKPETRKRLQPHQVYSAPEMWNRGERHLWRFTGEPYADRSYAMGASCCKAEMQDIVNYPGELVFLSWPKNPGDEGYETIESELSTEPGVYYIAYRASGDGYTRYLTKDALLQMPPVVIPHYSDYDGNM